MIVTMAFNPEELDSMLNDYGIVVSERTRRLIHRNNKKLKVPERIAPCENVVWNTIKSFFLFWKGVIHIVCRCLLWIATLFIWLILYVLKLALEMYICALIIYVVFEYVKRIEQSHYQ